jgi:hypothetical protein
VIVDGGFNFVRVIMLDFNLHLWENIETISFCRKLNTLMVYKSISQINPPQQVFVN